MPDFSYQPKTTNDKSQLTPGWHPAFLMAIADEETPPDWQMAKQSPRLWRWQFAVWESPASMRDAPEMQSTPTSQKFSPGGKYQASKAYVFTRKLLNRQIEAGEHVSLDPLMPLPCQVLISRTDKNGAPIEYANITDLQAWPDGAAALTAEVRTNLASWLQAKQAAPTPPAPAPVPPPTVPQPAAWAQPAVPGAPNQAATSHPAKAGW